VTPSDDSGPADSGSATALAATSLAQPRDAMPDAMLEAYARAGATVSQSKPTPRPRLSDEVIARAAVGGNEAVVEDRTAVPHPVDVMVKADSRNSAGHNARKFAQRSPAGGPRGAMQKQAALSIDGTDAAASAIDEAAADPPRRADLGTILSATSSALSADGSAPSANRDERSGAARAPAGAGGVSRRANEDRFTEPDPSAKDGRSSRHKPAASGTPLDWLAMPF